MDKRNGAAILGVVFVAVLLLVIGLTQRKQPEPAVVPDGDVVVICVDGEEYARVSFDVPQTVTVSQSDGSVNVIRITGEEVYMLSSTCENQNCVHMTAVTRDNWEWRVNGAFIICLPNRVSVELAVKE